MIKHNQSLMDRRLVRGERNRLANVRKKLQAAANVARPVTLGLQEISILETVLTAAARLGAESAQETVEDLMQEIDQLTKALEAAERKIYQMELAR